MEYKVKDLADFVNNINSFKPVSEMLSCPSILLFRGQSKLSYNLQPSLGRYPSKTWMNTWQTVEYGLVETAQQKFPLLFPQSDYPAILLAKLQHYGIGTRMLDLTRNAFVALYFACKSHPEEDGEVFVFSAHTVSAYDPVVNAIADTYRLTHSAWIDVEEYFYRVTKQPYYSSRLYRKTETDFTAGLVKFVADLHAPLFVEAGNICERQKNQDGYFLLFPSKLMNFRSVENGESKTVKQCVDKLVDFPKSDKSIVARLTIPKELKSDILDQLQNFGITDEFLFADSVDDVCKCIMQNYRKHYPDDLSSIPLSD